MIGVENSISIDEIIDEILKTNIFKKIAMRNDPDFTRELALWMVRYVLVISSMNESLNIDLQDILRNLHGDKYREILEATETIFYLITKKINE